MELLAVTPARAGSKRIPDKNIRDFFGKPLIAHTIEQAKECNAITRHIVDTDSEEIAEIAKRYGAEVPFLRPSHLAHDTANVVDSVLHLLGKLKESEGYEPDYVMILQTTSPLREREDIERSWQEILKGGATTVLTVCPTHPRLYHLDENNFLRLVNGTESQSTNVQEWPLAYILNGCFVYIIETRALLREKVIITEKTRGVVCPRWRSVDLDTEEDWKLAELLYKNKKHFYE